MPNPPRHATYDDPLTESRIEPFIRDISINGSKLVQELSEKINTVSVQRAMQIGYMMACEDHALPLPDFDDPADKLFGVEV